MRSLKKLSDAATRGEWSVFDVRGVVEIQAADQKPVVHWSGFDQSFASLSKQRANARFASTLVNAYRAGRLHDDTALAAAEAKGRAAGIEEAAKLVEERIALNLEAYGTMSTRAHECGLILGRIRPLQPTEASHG